MLSATNIIVLVNSLQRGKFSCTSVCGIPMAIFATIIKHFEMLNYWMNVVVKLTLARQLQYLNITLLYLLWASLQLLNIILQPHCKDRYGPRPALLGRGKDAVVYCDCFFVIGFWFTNHESPHQSWTGLALISNFKSSSCSLLKWRQWVGKVNRLDTQLKVL